MKTIVKSIRQSGPAEEFVVEVLVNGMAKAFRLSVVLPGLHSITAADRSFLDTFQYSMAPRKIAGLVIDTYKGQAAKLPIDLGDI